MRASDLLPGRPQEPAHGIDRMVKNVQTGRFERSLSALPGQPTGAPPSQPASRRAAASRG